mgnify:CR=1 FL=1
MLRKIAQIVVKDIFVGPHMSEDYVLYILPPCNASLLSKYWRTRYELDTNTNHNAFVTSARVRVILLE